MCRDHHSIVEQPAAFFRLFVFFLLSQLSLNSPPVPLSLSLQKKKIQVSGAVPEEPVVSKVSGHLFERRLLEKAVADSGVDPVTKSPMRLPDDSVVVRATGGASASGGSGGVAPPKPRPSPAASVPGLIGLFRDEWDALALETHQLRASLHSARQELAHALYQHDAALRVIARLVRERDAARDAYEARAGGAAADLPAASEQQQQPEKKEQQQQQQQQSQQPAAKKAKTQERAAPPPLKQEVVAAFTALSEELSKGRKKRVPPAGCATAESVRSFGPLERSPHALHKARTPGVTCVAAAGPGSSLVASGGLDGDVCVLDASTGAAVASFAHVASSPADSSKKQLPAAASRAVTDVAFVRRALLASAGADGAVRLWRPTRGDEGSADFLDADDAAGASSSSSSWALCAEAAASEASDAPAPSSSSSSSTSAVVALAVHPSRDYLATAGADGEWRLYDLEKAATTTAAAGGGGKRRGSAPPALLSRLVSVPDAASGGYSSAAFHPDGVILGVGTRGGAVRIWDARSMRAVAKFEGHSPAAASASASASSALASAGVTGLSFSENGYYLATGAGDGVKAWDLRKLKNLASVPGPSSSDGAGDGGGGSGNGGVSRLAFDPSGYLLAVAGPGGVEVLGSKQEWAPLCRLQGGNGGEGGGSAAERRKAGALSVAWSSSGDVLFAGGSDNCLRAFGASPASA